VLSLIQVIPIFESHIDFALFGDVEPVFGKPSNIKEKPRMSGLGGG
jgi:hypothetical protein